MLVEEHVYAHPTQASRVVLSVFDRPADESPVEGLPDGAGFLVTETWRGTSKVVKSIGFFASRDEAAECLRRRAEALSRQLFKPVAASH